MQFYRIRGGQVAVHPLAADHIAGCANQAANAAHSFKNRLDKVACCGLALGAGYTDQFKLLIRKTIKSARYQRHCRTVVGDQQLRHLQIFLKLADHQGNSAVFYCLGRKTVRIKCAPLMQKSFFCLFPAVSTDEPLSIACQRQHILLQLPCDTLSYLLTHMINGCWRRSPMNTSVRFSWYAHSLHADYFFIPSQMHPQSLNCIIADL